MRDTTKIANDRRQRSRHDRLIERRQQRHQQQRREHQTDTLLASVDRLPRPQLSQRLAHAPILRSDDLDKRLRTKALSHRPGLHTALTGVPQTRIDAEALEDAPEDIDPFDVASMSPLERARLVARVVKNYPKLAELAPVHLLPDVEEDLVPEQTDPESEVDNRAG
jgi:hypothetical protein